MSIIQAVRDFFAECPLLKSGSKLGVDFLGALPTEYMIAPVPCSPVIKKYTDGGSVRQFQFVFAVREEAGQSTVQNLENSGFCEALADWIEANEIAGNYPDLGENRNPQGLKVLSNGTVYNAEENTAEYQIMLRLTYYQNWRYHNGQESE